jgi:hypothetical protein
MTSYSQTSVLSALLAWLVSILAVKILRVEDEGRVALISRNHDTVLYFPDNATLRFFGFNYDDLKPISSVGIKSLDLHLAGEIPQIDPNLFKSSSDFDIAQNKMLQILQDDDTLVGVLWHIGDVVNPAIIFFQGYYMAVGRQVQTKRVNTDKLVFSWLKKDLLSASFSVDEHLELYGIGPGYSCLGEIHGEDPRMLLLNDSLVMVTSWFQQDQRPDFENVMHVTYLQLNGSHPVLAEVNDTFLKSDNTREKNWSPFLYKGQLMFVYKLVDHFIVTQQEFNDPSVMKIVSSTSSKHLRWNFGSIRGGTPGRLIGGRF